MTHPGGNSGPAGPEETSVADVMRSPVARHSFFVGSFLSPRFLDDDDVVVGDDDDAGLFFFLEDDTLLLVAVPPPPSEDKAEFVFVFASSSIANTVDEAREPTELRDGPLTSPEAPLPPPT